MKHIKTDFDVALAFLKVSRSTLHRWLRDGRIPARKVGGQWRFSESDLRKFRDGAGDPPSLARAREDLRRFLQSARTRRKDSTVATAIQGKPQDLAEALVWEARDQGATDIHLQPRRDGVHIAFRLAGELKPVRIIPTELAAELAQAWDASGRPFGETGFRRIFLSRSPAAAVNEVSLISQSLETLQGRRITLRFMGGGRVADLDLIAPRPEDRAVFMDWLSRPSGLILFSGMPGSGKTTTLLSCLQSLARDAGQAVFSLECPAYLRVDGVDQVEVEERDAPSVAVALERIARMAPNAVGLCLETPATAAAALRLAATGHLVLMQTEADGEGAALSRFEEMAGGSAGSLLIGTVAQRLTPDGSGGRVAEYRFQAGPRPGRPAGQ